MRKIDLSDEMIEELFKGTNFGGPEKTNIGRRGQMIDCILKHAAGYADGNTIDCICMEAGLLTKDRVPTRSAIRWAFDQLYVSHQTLLERLHQKSA